MCKKLSVIPILGVVCALAACQPQVGSRSPQRSAAPMGNRVPVTIAESALNSTACEGRFVVHTLPFANGTRMREMRTYASNGSGVAVNDLDDDGDLDLVFAGIDRQSEILWNEGNLNFKPQPLDASFTRGVAIVDVDGDGRLDITFTHRTSEGVSFWRNSGRNDGAGFTRQPLPGVDAIAYSMAWADMNEDGRLDLVTASYNTELKKDGIEPSKVEANAGVFYYENMGGSFEPRRLANYADALAVALLDLNGDGQRDIWIGNDFVTMDQVWLQRGDGWAVAQPFERTSYSTMSIDWGDIDNDGSYALLTTDMNPRDTSPRNLAAWLPVITKLPQNHVQNDPQIMANVLLIRNGDGWRNSAPRRGIDSTGWSWAGRFGDLDNDGLLDAYVVNGMIADDLFGHLPSGELVEQNMAFRNIGGAFQPADDWQLGSIASGRGMMMADLDNDGDLDIVVNNLRNSAEMFENRLCGGSSVQVELAWPGSANTRAIGAQVALHTNKGVFMRDVRSVSGYLSGDPARVHFGFPADATLQELIVRWPDGATSTVDSFSPNTLLKVTR